MMLAILGVSIGALGGMSYFRAGRPDMGGTAFTCPSPKVIDGDTIRCGDRRIRLYGIDAPELPGHCRPGRNCAPGDPYASTEHLQSLIGVATLECSQKDIDVYGRIVARCSAGETDLSCAQIKDGQAIRRYGVIFC
ncbi:MAG: thermonuclease family protein [Novosphingobium sp.]